MRYLFVPEDNKKVIKAALANTQFLLDNAEYNLAVLGPLVDDENLEINYKTLFYLMAFLKSLNSPSYFNYEEYIYLINRFKGICNDVDCIFNAFKLIEHSKTVTHKNYASKKYPNYLIHFFRSKKDPIYYRAKKSGNLESLYKQTDKENSPVQPR